MKITETITHIRTACDECGSTEHGADRCCGCGKDICRQCSVVCALDGDEHGDYPPQSCRQCKSLSTPYAEGILKAQQAYDSEYDLLMTRWKDLCRNFRENP